MSTLSVGLECSLGSSWLSGEVGRVAQADAGYSVDGFLHLATCIMSPPSRLDLWRILSKCRLLFVCRLSVQAVAIRGLMYALESREMSGSYSKTCK